MNWFKGFKRRGSRVSKEYVQGFQRNRFKGFKRIGSSVSKE
jgi:hypothetical protein